MINTTALLLVQDNLQQLAAILLCPDTLANDFDGIHKVSEDRLVDSSQSTRARALLLLGRARACGSLGTGKNAARRNDQDLAVGELLLEFTGKTIGFEIVGQL